MPRKTCEDETCPLNEDGEDHELLECDNCGEWFHESQMKSVQLTKHEGMLACRDCRNPYR